MARCSTPRSDGGQRPAGRDLPAPRSAYRILERLCIRGWKIMTQTTSPLRALLNVEASASVPKLSNAQMLEAPENSAIRDIWLLPPDNPDLHAGRKLAVVETDAVEEFELTTVLTYFRSRGAHLDFIPPKKPTYPDSLAPQLPPR